MRLILLALALVSVPAAAADQFDLVCTAKGGGERFRVDLKTGEWCVRDCASTQKIAAATTTHLRFVSHEPQFEGDEREIVEVNRATGEWVRHYDNPKFPLLSERLTGMCEVAQFSGFPSVRF